MAKKIVIAKCSELCHKTNRCNVLLNHIVASGLLNDFHPSCPLEDDEPQVKELEWDNGIAEIYEDEKQNIIIYYMAGKYYSSLYVDRGGNNICLWSNERIYTEEENKTAAREHYNKLIKSCLKE